MLPNSMGHTRTYGKKKKSRGHNLKSNEGGTMIFAHHTLSLPDTYSY